MSANVLVALLLVVFCADNKFDTEGVEALAPALAKLTQLQALNLASEWREFGTPRVSHSGIPLDGACVAVSATPVIWHCVLCLYALYLPSPAP